MSSMKLNNQIMKKIEKFALSKAKNNIILHRREHVHNVVKMCKILAKEEKADFRICKTAALLHDIEKNKKGDHAKLGADISRKFLRCLKLDENIIEHICYAIYRHNKGLPNKTIESRVVHDADNLEAIGPSGFLRHFMWAVITKKMDFNQSIKDAVKEHEKFYNWLQTKTAKRIGKQRIKQTKEFLKYLKRSYG